MDAFAPTSQEMALARVGGENMAPCSTTTTGNSTSHPNTVQLQFARTVAATNANANNRYQSLSSTAAALLGPCTSSAAEYDSPVPAPGYNSVHSMPLNSLGQQYHRRHYNYHSLQNTPQQCTIPRGYASCSASIEQASLLEQFDAMPALSLPPTNALIPEDDETHKIKSAGGTGSEEHSGIGNVEMQQILDEIAANSSPFANHRPCSYPDMPNLNTASAAVPGGSTTPALSAVAASHPRSATPDTRIGQLNAQLPHVKIEDEDVVSQVNALFRKAELRAQDCKQRIRAELKRDLQGRQHMMSPRDRSLMRSRREARVSRVKSEEFAQALQDIIRELVVENAKLRAQVARTNDQLKRLRPDAHMAG